MNTKIDTENVYLVYSNRICCFNDDYTRVYLDISDKATLNLTFKFHYNNDNEETRCQISSPENGFVILNLYNFNNPLGSGTISPYLLGTLNDKKIYIKFYVYKIAKCDPILDFSIYMEK